MGGVSAMRVFRTFRCLRPLRAMSRMEGLKVVRPGAGGGGGGATLGEGSWPAWRRGQHEGREYSQPEGGMGAWSACV